MTIPTLFTSRLTLRAFHESDASQAERLTSEEAVARFTFVPRPSPVGGARSWIAGHEQDALARRRYSWAVVREAALVGGVELAFDDVHGWAELGFWLGVPYQRLGYASEAAACALTYAFEADVALRRVQAAVFVENTSSRALLERLGFRCEGVLRALGRPGPHRGGDMAMYAMTREDFVREIARRSPVTRPASLVPRRSS
ncbi:GNAT family N-acetyltransferase [Deinococcus pimensis]|uniref:GNAT family N-acetyltransferase n=1 Tax=Deinococcus pimensis TaxID=309888 RepID=UPI0004851A2D|nr:GNAT family N-acetyltransferase [Deinococcus pimensis]